MYASWDSSYSMWMCSSVYSLLYWSTSQIVMQICMDFALIPGSRWRWLKPSILILQYRSGGTDIVKTLLSHKTGLIQHGHLVQYYFLLWVPISGTQKLYDSCKISNLVGRWIPGDESTCVDMLLTAKTHDVWREPHGVFANANSNSNILHLPYSGPIIMQ